jgi:hypothetical protein
MKHQPISGKRSLIRLSRTLIFSQATSMASPSRSSKGTLLTSVTSSAKLLKPSRENTESHHPKTSKEQRGDVVDRRD